MAAVTGRWLWVIITYLSVKITFSGTENKGPFNVEVCREQSLEAKCNQGHVVVFISAQYGRMKLGRCVQTDFGLLGCSVDVLDKIHKLCSGQQECFITNLVGAELLGFQPCGELLGYLTASYKCVSVVNASPSQCQPDITSPLPLPQGTLSSAVTESSSCGSPSHPWRLRLGPSQEVTFSLREYPPPPASRGSRGGDCEEEYGRLVERTGNRVVTLCSGSQDVRIRGTDVDVSLKLPGEVKNKYILLHYTVTGCPEPAVSPDLWVKRGQGYMIVGCYTTRQSWRLECTNNTWTGQVGNCTNPLPLIPMDSPSSVQELPPVQEESIATSVDTSSDMIMLGSICGGVFLSLMLLAVGLLFDKSSDKELPHKHPNHTTPMPSRSLNGTMYNTGRKPQNGLPIDNATSMNNTDPLNSDTSPPDPHYNQNERTQLLDPQYDRSVGSRSLLSRSSAGDYDVPHYYELDPDYRSPMNNGLVQTPDYIIPMNNGPVHGGQHSLGRVAYLH